MARARVVIIEDHPLVAQGLRALLQARCDVLEIVSDARQVPAALERWHPEVVLLDLSMPRRNGLELLPVIKRMQPGARVLVVTMHVDRALCDLAIKAGADGFVPKEASADELRGALAAVIAGEQYISPRVPKRGYRSAEVLAHPSLDRLTPRHREILRLVGEGKSSQEIGDELGLSPRTVEFHRGTMRKLLGITTEWGLVRFAIVAGLSDEGAETGAGEKVRR